MSFAQGIGESRQATEIYARPLSCRHREHAAVAVASRLADLPACLTRAERDAESAGMLCLPRLDLRLTEACSRLIFLLLTSNVGFKCFFDNPLASCS